MKFDAADWHNRVRQLFLASPGYHEYRQKAPVPYKGRIIPLCTPVPNRVNVVVIGKNHSKFVESDEQAAEKIAIRYSEGVPSESTYLYHNHSFATGLRDRCRAAGIKIDSSWVGTNRCPIQTGPTGSDLVIESNWFRQLSPDMDRLLRELILKTETRYVLTCGKYASDLFFEREDEKKCVFAKSQGWRGVKFTAIRINHPSLDTKQEQTVNTLHQHLIL